MRRRGRIVARSNNKQIGVQRLPRIQLQERLIFVPTTEIYGSPEVVGLDFSDVWLKTPDGERLHAWYLDAGRPGAPPVLFAHGNTGNLSGRLGTLRQHGSNSNLDWG